MEDVEARRLELSAELRAAQAAAQIFEAERFEIMVRKRHLQTNRSDIAFWHSSTVLQKKVEDERIEKAALQSKVDELSKITEELKTQKINANSENGEVKRQSEVLLATAGTPEKVVLDSLATSVEHKVLELETVSEEVKSLESQLNVIMQAYIQNDMNKSSNEGLPITNEGDNAKIKDLSRQLQEEKDKKNTILQRLEDFEEKMVVVQQEKQEIEDKKNAILEKLEAFEEKMVMVQQEKQETENESQVDIKMGKDLNEELKNALGQVEALKEKVQSAEQSNEILSQLLKAERENSMAASKGRRLFGGRKLR